MASIKNTSIVQYSGFSAADAQEIAEEAAKGSTGGFFTAKVGRNLLRFLPGRPGQKTVINVPQHWVQLPGMEKGTSINCASLIEGKPCLVCEYMARMGQTGNAADYRIADALKPKRRSFAGVLLRTDEGRGPLIYGFGMGILADILELQSEKGDFTHPVDGYDICVKRTGTTKTDTKYKVTKDIDVPLSEDADMLAQILEALPNLEMQRAVPTRDEIIELCGDAMVAVARPRGIHTKAKPAAASTRRAAPVTASVEDDLDQSAEDDDQPYQ